LPLAKLTEFRLDPESHPNFRADIIAVAIPLRQQVASTAAAALTHMVHALFAEPASASDAR
jgi:hypothetical protein